VAEIDLQALRQNVDVIAAMVGPAVGVMAVVKADAYGHGAAPCARAIERKVWGFAVSLVEEGVELRRGGVEAPIVVLGSFYGLSHRDALAYRLTPVVGDSSDLQRFARAAEDLGLGRVGLHLKIDTGMSRLGVRPEQIDAFVAELRRHPVLAVDGVCTHLAEADAGDPAVSEAQLARFAEARARLAAHHIRPTLTHVANSAGTARFATARFDLVRPGLALWGVDSVSPSTGAHGFVGLTPVMSLKSRVVAVRELPAGARVSYGGTFEVKRSSRIATVPIGYADGYTRRLSGRAEVLVAGRRCPVAGIITMDMSMVDVTDVPCAVGDEVVLLGQQGKERITADELAERSGTIPWEIFCGISKRVPRIYKGDR
jgi:alanine racemase